MNRAHRIFTALTLLGLNASAPALRGSPAADVGLMLSGVRNTKGVVQVCLTDRSTNFLNCKDDPTAVRRTIPAGGVGNGRIAIGPVQPGIYALLVFHDENVDGKLNSMLGLPREGFGFSANPSIRMRAPRWEEVRVSIPAGMANISVRMRYII